MSHFIFIPSRSFYSPQNKTATNILTGSSERRSFQDHIMKKSTKDMKALQQKENTDNFEQIKLQVPGYGLSSV